mmetsp:Transcript_97419/g.275516  ORF Transcript_97419/g.275516 Transcript_97419/m.275516 type:complete len:228 (+) Transcript_97419:1502-2185(+)
MHHVAHGGLRSLPHDIEMVDEEFPVKLRQGSKLSRDEPADAPVCYPKARRQLQYEDDQRLGAEHPRLPVAFLAAQLDPIVRPYVLALRGIVVKGPFNAAPAGSEDASCQYACWILDAGLRCAVQVLGVHNAMKLPPLGEASRPDADLQAVRAHMSANGQQGAMLVSMEARPGVGDVIFVVARRGEVHDLRHHQQCDADSFMLVVQLAERIPKTSAAIKDISRGACKA